VVPAVPGITWDGAVLKIPVERLIRPASSDVKPDSGAVTNITYHISLTLASSLQDNTPIALSVVSPGIPVNYPKTGGIKLMPQSQYWEKTRANWLKAAQRP
jgi:hypothetical protein